MQESRCRNSDRESRFGIGAGREQVGTGREQVGAGRGVPRRGLPASGGAEGDQGSGGMADLHQDRTRDGFTVPHAL